MVKKVIIEHRSVKVESQLETCKVCKGTGVIPHPTNILAKTICPACKGKGKVRV